LTDGNHIVIPHGELEAFFCNRKREAKAVNRDIQDEQDFSGLKTNMQTG